MLGGKQLPVPLGDDLDGAVGHFDGGLIVNRVPRHRHVPAPPGLAYAAVGMQRALDSAIGLPRSSTSASWMLVFLMPADVRRNLKMTPRVSIGARLSATAARFAHHGWPLPEVVARH